jgi:hypothetical protein
VRAASNFGLWVFRATPADQQQHKGTKGKILVAVKIHHLITLCHRIYTENIIRALKNVNVKEKSV